MNAYRDANQDDEWEDTVYIGHDIGDDDGEADDEPTTPCPYCQRALRKSSPECFCIGAVWELCKADLRKQLFLLWLAATALLSLATVVWWFVRHPEKASSFFL